MLTAVMEKPRMRPKPNLMGGWAEGGSSWPHKTQKGSRGILLVSLFVTLTNHSLTIYYNLIYSLSASWPAAEEMRGSKKGAGTPKPNPYSISTIPKIQQQPNAAASTRARESKDERAWWRATSDQCLLAHPERTWS